MPNRSSDSRIGIYRPSMSSRFRREQLTVGRDALLTTCEAQPIESPSTISFSWVLGESVNPTCWQSSKTELRRILDWRRDWLWLDFQRSRCEHFHLPIYSNSSFRYWPQTSPRNRFGRSFQRSLRKSRIQTKLLIRLSRYSVAPTKKKKGPSLS